MQQFFDQLLRFLQQGIAAIFRFVELIWGWSVAQISSLMRVPWSDWPLWKQIFLAAVISSRCLCSLQSGHGALGSRRENIGGLCDTARRACADVAERDDRRSHRTRRPMGAQQCRFWPSCRPPRSIARGAGVPRAPLGGSDRTGADMTRSTPPRAPRDTTCGSARRSCELSTPPQAGAGPCRSRLDTWPSRIAAADRNALPSATRLRAG